MNKLQFFMAKLRCVESCSVSQALAAAAVAMKLQRGETTHSAGLQQASTRTAGDQSATTKLHQ